MKNKNFTLFWLIALFSISLSFGQTKYVASASDGGSASNTGNTESSPWTLDHALDQIDAGNATTVYVKAGSDYAPITNTVTRDATESNPISIIGYKNTINDIVAVNGSTLYTGGMPDATEAPLIKGTTTTNRPDQNNGLKFYGDWYIIKNLSFYSYNQPFESTGANSIVDNIYSYKSGNHNPADLGGFSTVFPTGSYTGWGIRITGDNHQLTNSYVLDAGAEGIKVYGPAANFVHRNNTVRTILGVGPYYGDWTQADGNSTDYHYLTSGNTSGGRYYNISVIQKNGMNSDGHGIVFKSSNDSQPITDMIVDGWYVFNSKIESQFPNVTNITFDNGEMDSDETTSRLTGKEANFANGGSDIIIKNSRFLNGTHVALRGWQDIYNVTYPYAVDGIKFLNCYFGSQDREQAIRISHGPGNSDSHEIRNVTFDHCTFENFTGLAYMSADFSNINFINSIVLDIPTYYFIGYHDGPGGAGGEGGPYPLSANWSSVNFSGGFGARSGTNITTFDPQLDSEGITTNSSLASAGISTADYSAGLPIGYFGNQSLERYVATPADGGSSSNNGLTSLTPWTIQHADGVATAGMTVHIKAGNYGDLNLVFNQNGTSENPIKFIGYKNTPGDIVATNGPTFNWTDLVDSSEMPLLLGTRVNDKGVGRGIQITGDHVHFSNFQVSEYMWGVDANGDGIILDNIISTFHGNFDPSESYFPGNGNSSHLNLDAGSAILVRGNGNQVNNCYAGDNGSNGITFSNFVNGSADGNMVYTGQNINPTDYYFFLSGGTTGSTFTNTRVYRDSRTSTDSDGVTPRVITHLGHGLVAKDDDPITGNTIDGFEILSTNLEVQFPGVSNNVFKNGKVISDLFVSDLGGGIQLANGSHDNEYQNIYVHGLPGVKFADWADGLAGDVNESSYNNNFRNCIFRGSTDIANTSKSYGIMFYWFSQAGDTNTPITSAATNNKFYNCNFDYVDALIVTNRPGDAELINCSITNVEDELEFAKSGEIAYSPTITYTNTNFFGNVFGAQPGVGNTSVDPLYLRTGTDEDVYKIPNNSPLKDAGITVSGLTTDFGEGTYLNSPPIGAWDFGSTSSNPDPNPDPNPTPSDSNYKKKKRRDFVHRILN